MYMHMNYPNTDGTETWDVCRGCMLAALQIGQKDVLVNCMHQSTDFPGQLDRASATFPFIMYYAVFQHLFLWGVQGGRTVFKTRQLRRLNNASNNSKTKIIEPMYSVKHYVISIYNLVYM